MNRKRIFEYGFLVVGAVLVNLALVFGADVDWGWWSVVFWAGFGFLGVWVRR